MKTEPGTEKLAARFVRMFKCDTARITRPCGRWFLVIGWNRNTKNDEGQWQDQDGNVRNWDYIHEEVIANGENEEELIASAKHYKQISGMTWDQVFKKGLKWAFPTMTLFVLISCSAPYHHAAVYKNGLLVKEETDFNPSIGGVHSQKGADGYQADDDNQQSFSDAVTGLVTYGAAKVSGNTTVSTNASNNAKDAYSTQVNGITNSKPTITTSTGPLGGVIQTVTPAAKIPNPPKF